jgi:hypothetical protein
MRLNEKASENINYSFYIVLDIVAVLIVQLMDAGIHV